MKSKAQICDSWINELSQKMIEYRYEVLFKKKDNSISLEEKKKAILGFYSNEDNITDLIKSLSDSEYNLLLERKLNLECYIPRNNEKLYDYFLYNDKVIPEVALKINSIKLLYEDSPERIDIKAFLRALFALISSKGIRPSISGKGIISKLSEIFTNISTDNLITLITHFKEMCERDNLINNSYIDFDKAKKILALSQIEALYHLLSFDGSIEDLFISQIKKSELCFVLEDKNKTPAYTITGELFVYFESDSDDELIYQIAEPVTIDRICVYRITKESIRSAFDNGLTENTIISKLRGYGVINSLFESRLAAWREEYEMTHLHDCLYLETSRQQAIVIESIENIKNYIIKKVGTYSFIFKRDRKVIDILKHSGFDMLCEKELSNICEETQLSPLEIVKFNSSLSFKERLIPFDEGYKEKLKAIALDNIFYLIDDNRILTRKQAENVKKLCTHESIWALDYQKKVQFLTSMCNIRFLELRFKDEIIKALPLKVELPNILLLTTNGEERNDKVEKIFKVSELD